CAWHRDRVGYRRGSLPTSDGSGRERRRYWCASLADSSWLSPCGGRASGRSDYPWGPHLWGSRSRECPSPWRLFSKFEGVPLLHHLRLHIHPLELRPIEREHKIYIWTAIVKAGVWTESGGRTQGGLGGRRMETRLLHI